MSEPTAIVASTSNFFISYWRSFESFFISPTYSYWIKSHLASLFAFIRSGRLFRLDFWRSVQNQFVFDFETFISNLKNLKTEDFRLIPSFLAHFLLVVVPQLCLKLYSFLRWLLVPELAAKMLVRYLMALFVLWNTHAVWIVIVGPMFQRIFSNILMRLFATSIQREQQFQLKQKMEVAVTYEEWKEAADQLDALQGKNVWKEDWRSSEYDYHRIKDDICTLREFVDKQDVKNIMDHCRSRLLRNLVGINNKPLYSVLRAGTKKLIEEYISEVVRALQLVCEVETPDIDNEQKLAFFNETRHSYGRSALLLSGGATLGLYHTGVCKALLENNLLPRIMSGSSTGAVICSIVGTRTDEECRDLLSRPDGIKLNFFPPPGGSVRRKLKRLFTTGVLMDIEILAKGLRQNVEDYTFQEAYERTGRIINIVVSPATAAGNLDRPRLLNYLTAPNVLVWSAALASCAIPGVYAPVELMAKDADGLIVPYYTSDAYHVHWEDGSIQSDLPMPRLSELFNVNHFIVSQVNPHVIPFLLTDAHELSNHEIEAPGIIAKLITFIVQQLLLLLSQFIDFLGSELKTRLVNLAKIQFVPIPKSFAYLLDQKYVGDITLAPKPFLADYLGLLTNPTQTKLSQCLAMSERQTWKKLAAIRGSCEIEFTLDDCVRRMRGELIIEKYAENFMGENKNRVSSWSADVFSHYREPNKDNHNKDIDDASNSIPTTTSCFTFTNTNSRAKPSALKESSSPSPPYTFPKNKKANTNVHSEDDEDMKKLEPLRIRSLPPTPRKNVDSPETIQHPLKKNAAMSTADLRKLVNIDLPPYRPTPPRNMSSMDLTKIGGGFDAPKRQPSSVRLSLLSSTLLRNTASHVNLQQRASSDGRSSPFHATPLSLKSRAFSERKLFTSSPSPSQTSRRVSFLLDRQSSQTETISSSSNDSRTNFLGNSPSPRISPQTPGSSTPIITRTFSNGSFGGSSNNLGNVNNNNNNNPNLKTETSPPEITSSPMRRQPSSRTFASVSPGIQKVSPPSFNQQSLPSTPESDNPDEVPIGITRKLSRLELSSDLTTLP